MATKETEKATKASKASKQAEDQTASSGGEAKVHVLKVHHLRPAPGANRPRQRVGRGEGSKGKTAGRGTKGTKARKNVPARLEGGQMPLHMRLPKLRGFKNPFRTEYEVVNVGRIAELFPEGGDISVADLVAKGAVRSKRLVKVLGDGEIAVKVNVEADAFSQSAKDKIVAAGGSVAS
ncbi:MAG: 50S ribosomal protein L15 [Bifidobacteriaceae bacterium]|jgi:large subunit ribosomal protein L15|nr:50S ribosomal protein L15 [Bifidobacteriaceae bacterium]